MMDKMTPVAGKENIYQDKSGQRYKYKPETGEFSIYNEVDPVPNDTKADLSKTSVFNKDVGGKHAKIIITDSDGDGFDNNDKVQFEGDLSLYTPDELKKILKDYKSDDSRTGISLSELTVADDKKTINTEKDKEYSIGSFMKLLSGNEKKDTDSPKNYQLGLKSLIPGVNAAFGSGNGIFDNGGDGGALYIQIGMENINNLLYGANKQTGDGSTTDKSNLVFADQPKTDGKTIPTDKSQPVVNPKNNDKVVPSWNSDDLAIDQEEDEKVNKLNNGAEADRLWELAHDEKKYKAGYLSGCSEDVLPQDQKSFKTKDGTEYIMQGISQYTTPGTHEKSYRAVFKSKDGKIAILTNSNESNKIINGKRNDDGFVRGVHRAITFYNPVENKGEIDDKIVPVNPIKNKSTKVDSPVDPAGTESAETYTITIEPGESDDDIKKKLRENHFDDSAIDEIFNAISIGGLTDPGTFTLKKIGGSWKKQ